MASAAGAAVGLSAVDSFINELAKVGASIIRGIYSIITKPSILYAVLTALPVVINAIAQFSQTVSVNVSNFAQSILQFANYLFDTVYNYVRSQLPTLSGALSWLNYIFDAMAYMVAGLLALPFYIAGYIIEYVVSPLIQFFIQVEAVVLNGIYQFLCSYVVPYLGYLLGIYMGYKGFEYFAKRGSIQRGLVGAFTSFVMGFIGNYELQALLSATGLGCQSVIPTLPPVSITVTKLPGALVQLSYTINANYSYQFVSGGVVKLHYNNSLKYKLNYGCFNCEILKYMDSLGYSLQLALPKGRYYLYTDSLTYSIQTKILTPVSLSGQQSIVAPVSFNYLIYGYTLCNSISTTSAFYVVCTEKSTASDYYQVPGYPSSGCSTTVNSSNNLVSINCTENATASDQGSA